MSCLLWLLFPFMELFVKRKNNIKNPSHKFLSLFYLHSFSQTTSISYVEFRSFCLTIFTQIPSSNRYEKVTPFMEFSVNGKKKLKVFPTSFLSLFHLHCSIQRTSISYVLFRSLCVTNFTQILSLNRYEKVTPFMEFFVNGKKN